MDITNTERERYLLTPEEVHVWIVDQDRSARNVRDLERILSSNERSQAAKFRFEKDQSRYTFSQGTLRKVLSRYVGLTPEELDFEFNQHGKPFLPQTGRAKPVAFNMSHSGSLVLIGIALYRLIGVDVEQIRRIDDLQAIAREYFTGDERALLDAAPENEKERMFYTCWTRKEAYIKAVGKGLSIPLNSFDTSMALGIAGRALEATADAPNVDYWWLSDLTVPTGYASALVIECARPEIKYKALS